MATKHLLPCVCGKCVPVETSQAGDRVTCECGSQVEVPPLRQLRELPLQQEPAEAAATRSDWAFHNGVLTAGLLLAVVLAGLGIWWWVAEPPAPEGFNPVVAAEQADIAVESVTPLQAYQRWVEVYEPMRRLEPVSNPRVEQAISHIEHMRLVRWLLLGAAAVVAVLSLLAYAQLKPRA